MHLQNYGQKDAAPSCLIRFEKLRPPRIRFMQKESRITGRIGQWASPLALLFRRWLVTHIPEFLNHYLHKRIFTGIV